jgi:hypothetical protein
MFAMKPIPEVKEVQLILHSGDCKINCCRAYNDCHLVSKYRTVRNVSILDVRTDLILGFKIIRHKIRFSNVYYLQKF